GRRPRPSCASCGGQRRTAAWNASRPEGQPDVMSDDTFGRGRLFSRVDRSFRRLIRGVEMDPLSLVPVVAAGAAGGAAVVWYRRRQVAGALIGLAQAQT